MEGWRLARANAATILEYVLADNSRSKRSFTVGLLTVYIVVLFLSLIQHALIRSNVVFLKIAEDLAGGYDLWMLPESNGVQTSVLLNYTTINQSLTLGANSVVGVAPRWYLRVNASNPRLSPTDPRQPVSVGLLIVDSEWEERIGLAPLWPHRPLGYQEVHVSGSLLRALNIEPKKGQRIRVQLDPLQMLRALNVNSSSFWIGPQDIRISLEIFGQFPPVVQRVVNRLMGVSQTDLEVTIPISSLYSVNELTLDCFVIDGVESNYGKYPSALGNVMIMEKSFVEALLSGNIAALVASPFLSSFFNNLDIFDENIRLNDYAMLASIMLKNRYDTYTSGSSAVNEWISQGADDIAKAVGLEKNYQLLGLLPTAINASDMMRIFLGEVFFTVIVVLCILSAVLVSSLLLSDVEDKTFEYGMLRTLGMTQGGLVILVCIQSLIFSLPGVLFGLLMSYLTAIPINYVLANYIGIPIDSTMDSSAISIGIVLGLALPIVGVFLPVRRALTKTIRDALDVYHKVVFDTSLQIMRLENIGLSLTETMISLILITIGVMIYYFVPLSFIYGELEMYFRIMTIILLMMIIGLVLLSQAFEGPVELLVARVIAFPTSDGNIVALTTKNLLAHASRNRKTAIMFTLCLGYVIFTATMFSLQSSSFSQNLEWIYGADIQVSAPGMPKMLPESKLRRFLDGEKVSGSSAGAILDYSFVTYPLSDMRPINSVSISRMAFVSRPSIQLFGVDRNFLAVALSEYAVYSELISGKQWVYNTSSGTVNMLDALYQPISLDLPTDFSIPQSILNPFGPENSFQITTNSSKMNDDAIPILISEALRDSSTMDTSNTVILWLGFSAGVGTGSMSIPARPIAMIKKFPGFRSLTTLQTSNTPALVSMDKYAQLLKQVQNATRTNMTSDIPKGSLYIKLSSSVQSFQIEAIINQINSLLADDSFNVVNLRSQVAQAESAVSLISVVFLIVAMVGVVLSFFVLFLSFTANIRENSWEVGVLRAIGLNTKKVNKIYIYESLSIVLACIILGTILGIVTATTATLQSILYTEMPFQIEFPFALFFVVSLISVALGIYGSYAPIQAFHNKPISTILRGDS